MSSRSNLLPKITDEIKKIKNSYVRTVLRSTEEYLTPLALRSIVEYIIELEGKDGISKIQT